MPPSQPWRDIPPANVVREGLGRLSGASGRLPRNATAAEQQKTFLIDKLFIDIHHYHQVPKDRLGRLLHRETLLRGIAA